MRDHLAHVTGRHTVCRPPSAATTDFGPAFAQALRDGVPVRMLSGLTQLQSETSFVIRNSNQDRRDLLNAEHRKLLYSRGNAERQSDRATTRRDQDRHADRATQYSNDLEAVEAELARLDHAETHGAELQDTFETDATFLLRGVAAMAQGDTLHTRELIHSVESILVDRRIDVLGNGLLQYSCHVRIPVAGGVASLGPITWVPRAQPTLTVALTWCATETALRQAQAQNAGTDPDDLTDEFGSPLSAPWRTVAKPPPTTTPTNQNQPGRKRNVLSLERHQLQGALEEIEVDTLKRATLLACPFPAVVWTVLAVHNGKAVPNWVPNHWRDERWQQWLHRVYTSEATWGHPGVWAHASWLRQGVLDVVLAHGGRATVNDVLTDLAHLDLDYDYLRTFSRQNGITHSKQRAAGPWFWPVQRDGDWPKQGQSGVPFSRFGFKVTRCLTCGQVAEMATRVGEIRGDLLCPAGHMPLADPNNPADTLTAGLVVPAEYQWLRVPQRVWTRQRHISKQSQSAQLSQQRRSAPELLDNYPRRRAVYSYLVKRRDANLPGATSAEIAQALGKDVSTISHHLRGLTELDLINRVTDVTNDGRSVPTYAPQ